MDFFELLQSRRSIRAYTPEAIAEAKVTRILEAANHAPSAGNLQAYAIVVVRHAATKAALSGAALNQESLTAAPVVLAFFAHQQLSAAKYRQRGVELYSVQDATVACAYAQLAAAALGLGSVWIGAFDEARVKQILQAQADWRPVALLPLGHPAESPAATSRRELAAIAREAEPGA
jgi:nitroreductase